MSALVWRAGLGLLGVAACLALGACARDPVVTGVNAISAGNWRIEQSKDRITDAPISSAVLTTRAVSHTAITFPPPAQMQLSCFKDQPVVIFAFQFKIGSTRNAEFGYRFDDRPGHQPRVRFVDDYIKVIIEDPAEVAPFVNELATSTIALRPDPLAQRRAHQRRVPARRRARGDQGGACRLPHRPRRRRAADRLQTYFGSRSSSSMEMPCGPRRKQILMPGRGIVGSMVNSTPFFLRSAAMASMPETARPKWSRP